MPDTVRTHSEILALLTADVDDSASPLIRQQDLRDAYVTIVFHLDALEDAIAALAGGGGADATPNAFSFTDVSGATVSTVHQHAPIVVAGINVPITALGTGGLTFSVNGGAFVTDATVVVGDSIVAWMTASANPGLTVSGALSLGTISDSWSITTVAETGVPAYFAVFAEHDGLTDWSQRDSALAGVADGKALTISLFGMFDDTSENQRIITSGNDRMLAQVRASDGFFELFLKNSGGTNVLAMSITGDIIDGVKHHILLSFDLANVSNRWARLDSVAASVTWTTYTDAAPGLIAETAWAVGADVGGGENVSGALGNLLIWQQFLPNVQATWDRFIDDSDNAVNPAGAIATWGEPVIGMRGPANAWAANPDGSGGEFVEHGLLVDGDPLAPIPTTIIVSVTANGDDGDEVKSSGLVSLTGSSIALSSDALGGFVFRTPGLAAGASIEIFRVQFTSGSTTAGANTTTIRGQLGAVSNFAASTGNLSGRAKTSASVQWVIPDWALNDRGANQLTPDLSPILQEIVDNPGYNGIVALFFERTGGGAFRSLVAFDHATLSPATATITRL